MIFEFVAVYQREAGTNVFEVLHERLKTVLTDNGNEFDEDATANMLAVSFERHGATRTDDAGIVRRRVLAGFRLNLPDDTADPRTVIDEWSDALLAPPIEHLVKFEDPLLQGELEKRGREIFDLEMKLRRAISVVYLHAYEEKPFELLREESLKPMNPTPTDQLKKNLENEFFSLTFTQYVSLNCRPEINKFPLMMEMIRNQETYEDFRTKITRLPIAHDRDAAFLASLRQLMNPIDAMRNCVAHNRSPSQNIENQYTVALPQVHAALDGFFESCEEIGDDNEMLWDYAAREAVENALRNADWDEEEGVIRIVSETGSHSVSDRDELVRHLEEIAGVASAENAPWDGGEVVFESDEETIVDNALQPYEKRLGAFFPAPE